MEDYISTNEINLQEICISTSPKKRREIDMTIFDDDDFLCSSDDEDLKVDIEKTDIFEKKIENEENEENEQPPKQILKRSSDSERKTYLDIEVDDLFSVPPNSDLNLVLENETKTIKFKKFEKNIIYGDKNFLIDVKYVITIQYKIPKQLNAFYLDKIVSSM